MTATRARWPILLLALSSLLLASCARDGERRGLFRKSAPPTQTAGERISVLDFERAIEAEAELREMDVALPPARVNPAWSQGGGSAAKAMGRLALGAGDRRLFSESIGRGSDATRRLNATPVILANRMVTIDTEGLVTAFNAETGQRLWQFRLGPRGKSARAAFGGGVSLEGERAYVTTGTGLVVALDAATGTEVWRTDLGTPLRGAPSVGEGKVVVMSQDNRLTALFADSGEQAWQVTATLEPAGILGPGAPAIYQGTVIAGFSSGELFALRIENGRTVWQDQLARTGRTTALGALSAIVAAPVVDRGRVFAVGHGGRIVAIEVATGQRVWERTLAGVHTPAVAGEFLFVVTTEAELVALTRGEGKIRWVADLGRWRNEKKKSGAIEWAGPVLAGDWLWLVSSRGDMVQVDPADGRIAARRRVGKSAYLPPVVANMVLYVLTEDGRVQAFR
ncbi:MAG: PQQ-binding-like beta-propeller repeat protein [Sphingomonadaceae bacterium]